MSDTPPQKSAPAGDDVLNAFFQEFNAIEWKTYKTFSALSSFEAFWGESERLLAEGADAAEQLHGPKWTPETEDEINQLLAERRAARSLHDEIMTPMLRYSAVVTLFTTFETELRRLGDNVRESKTLPVSHRDFRGPVVDQVSRMLEAFLGIRMKEFRTYQQITMLQRVRDCIVHCNGDPSISRDRDYLVGLNQGALGLEVDARMAIEVHSRFIRISVMAVRDFFADAFTSLGWRINDNWKKRMPPKAPEPK